MRKTTPKGGLCDLNDQMCFREFGKSVAVASGGVVQLGHDVG